MDKSSNASVIRPTYSIAIIFENGTFSKIYFECIKEMNQFSPRDVSSRFKCEIKCSANFFTMVCQISGNQCYTVLKNSEKNSPQKRISRMIFNFQITSTKRPFWPLNIYTRNMTNPLLSEPAALLGSWYTSA